MRQRAPLSLMPRVRKDIEQCARFVESFPRGKPLDRKRDIYEGFAWICEFPELNAVEAVRPATGIELRRHNVRQFAIVYAYFRPSDESPTGMVSIRAVKHWRVRNVFLGVRENTSATPGEETSG